MFASLVAGSALAGAVLVSRRPPVRGRLARARAGGAGARRSPAGRTVPGGAWPAPGAPSIAAARGTGLSARLPVEAVLELVASVLQGGAAPARATAAVGEALRAAGDPSGAALLAHAAGLPAVAPGGREGDADPAVTALAAALELAVATGSGPVALLRAAAADERRRRSAEQVRRARRLGVLVLLPTGLCLLPAFVLLTVAPLVLDLLGRVST